jgi:hypothetical protein
MARRTKSAIQRFRVSVLFEDVFVAFVAFLVTSLSTSVPANGFEQEKSSRPANQGEARQNDDEA